MHIAESPPDALIAPAAATARSDLAERARHAVAWATGLQLFRDVAQLGVTIALVRLLPTEAYGQFGLLTSVLTFLTFVSFREFLGHTLQVRDGAPVHYQDQFTAGAIVQAVIVVVANLVAVGFRWWPALAAVSPVLHVMSLLFVIDLPAEFRTRMLERQLEWRRLRLLQGAGFTAGAIVSVAMALAGLGVWALIVPTLIVPLPFVWDLLVTARWRPTWQFAWTRFRPAWRFGLGRILAQSLVAAAWVLEATTLAAVLGFSFFGIVNRAFGLAQLLCGRIGSLLSLAIYPVLTRVPPGAPAFERGASLYLRGVAWTVVPAAGWATGMADGLVRTVYGTRWLEATALLPWTMTGAATAAIVQTGYTVLLAQGAQRACLWSDAWRLAGIAVALAAALPSGTPAYLAGLCLVHGAGLVLVAAFLRQSGALSLRALVLALGPAVAGTAVAVAASEAARPHLDGLPGAWRAILITTGFWASYVVALRLAFAAPLRELLQQVPKGQFAAAVLGLR